MVTPLFLRRVAGAVLAVGAGTGFGYLLVNPLIFFPLEWVGRALMPLLIATKNYVESAEVAHLVQMSMLLFVRNFPNTVMVGTITVVVLRVLDHRRLVLYSALIWPLFLYMVKAGALRLGLPTDIGHLPVSPGFRYMAVFLLATFSFYLVGVLFVQHWLDKRKRNALASAGERSN